MHDLTDCQKAYIAGLVDGEGYIGLSLRKSRKPGKVLFYPRLSIGMTSKETIEQLRADMGEGTITAKKQENPKWKRAYVLSFNAKAVRRVLPVLLPYLRLKRPQAQLVMEYQSLLDDRPHGEDVQRRFIIIYEKLRALNHRGTSPVAPPWLSCVDLA